MIIHKISINNIRSYEKQEIKLGEGSTLLWGDIGSGKTSALLAIQFALFGLQPGQKGSELLRNGAIQGGVSIEFEIEGKNILVERTLKRGKSVSQDHAAITIDGLKQELSVTELKSKVLELLNYPKEFSRKQNLLYKFTVYAPQEEMKQIILQDSETRINTLRHIFGIDKYKKIIENASILVTEIRSEKRLKEGMTATLGQDKLIINSKEQELASKNESLLIIEKEFFNKQNERKKIELEIKEVASQREEKTRLKQEVEKTKIMVSTKESYLIDNKKLQGQLDLQIKDLQKILFDPEKIKQFEEEIESFKKTKRDLEIKILDISTKINSLSIKNQENDKVKEKLTHIEVCPTCLQDVNPSYKENVLNKINRDTYSNVLQIENLASEKKEILLKIKESEDNVSEREKQIQELNILKIKLQGIEEKQKRFSEIENSNKMLVKDIELLTKQLDILKSSILGLSKFDKIYEEKQKELEYAMRQEKISEIKLAELKKEIDMFSKQIQELKERVNKTEKIRLELNYLADLESWLTKQFIPMISSVEKNVMGTLKLEFSKLFSEWFSILVSDNFEVTLDDSFTPIVEQQDYIIDYAYLSGGERTAIALAYRLALNQVINSTLSDLKTKGLIILDEPTDGFSEQQLDKMRKVLEQLDFNQMIVVSHEQKIEGFVEKVIRLQKENNKSEIEV